LNNSIKTSFEEGETKGKIEGQLEKQKNNIITLLTIKLGVIPINLEEKIKNCNDIEKLDNIIKNIFNFDSFDDIEKILSAL